jgi:hypothetical protein
MGHCPSRRQGVVPRDPVPTFHVPRSTVLTSPHSAFGTRHFELRRIRRMVSHIFRIQLHAAPAIAHGSPRPSRATRPPPTHRLSHAFDPPRPPPRPRPSPAAAHACASPSARRAWMPCDTPRPSAASAQPSALSTQHSALSTQHSALSTQHSALLSVRYLLAIAVPPLKPPQKTGRRIAAGDRPASVRPPLSFRAA